MVFVLAMQISKAQEYDIYVPGDIVLTDNQWHTDDGYTVVEANNNIYLVIDPNGSAEYYTLPPFNSFAVSALLGEVVYSKHPYFWRGHIGWFVEASRAFYFVYPPDHYAILRTRPVYSYPHYSFPRFNIPRYYPPRPRYTPRPTPPPQPRHGTPNRPPQRPRDGFQNRPPQNPGSGVQNRPPQRSGGNGVQNRPPQRSGGNGVQNRPPQRSGSGTQNRPPQNSGGSSSRRR